MWLELAILAFKWGVVFTAPYAIYWSYFDKSFEATETLFKRVGLATKDDKTFKVLSKHDTNYGYYYSLIVPAGLSTDMIDKKAEELIQQLTGADGDILPVHTGPGTAVLKIYNNKLGFDYKFINYMDQMKKMEPMEYYMGIGREGPVRFSFNDDDANLLIGGKVGSGKSVCLKSLAVQTILYKPHVWLHCGDLKAGVEFGSLRNCNRIKSYADTPEDVKCMFRDLGKQMEDRYQLFKSEGVVNIKKFNKKYPKDRLKYHVILLDEVADLFMGTKDNDEDVLYIAEFMRKARAAGYHAVFCTQKPTSDALPTKIKNNLGARICFAVSDINASETIIGRTGGEKLPGKGRGYIKHSKGLELFQGLYIDDTKDEDRTGNNIETLIQNYIKVPEIVKPYIDTSGVIT